MWTSTIIITFESESNLFEKSGMWTSTIIIIFESESNLFEDQGCGRVLI